MLCPAVPRNQGVRGALRVGQHATGDHGECRPRPGDHASLHPLYRRTRELHLVPRTAGERCAGRAADRDRSASLGRDGARRRAGVIRVCLSSVCVRRPTSAVICRRRTTDIERSEGPFTWTRTGTPPARSLRTFPVLISLPASSCPPRTCIGRGGSHRLRCWSTACNTSWACPRTPPTRRSPRPNGAVR